MRRIGRARANSAAALSLTKTVRCTDTEMTFSYMADRQKIAPWGIHGGLAGGKAELLFKRAGIERMAHGAAGLQQDIAEQVRERARASRRQVAHRRAGRRRMGAAHGT